MLNIYLRHIPEGDTFHFEGEVDATLLDLGDAGAKPIGPLHYDLQVGISEGGIFATGKLSQRVCMTCVGCLEDFEYEITTKEFAMQRELDGREEVDLTPEVREDIQLLLPMHPKCDLSGNGQCPVKFSKAFSPAVRVIENNDAWSILDNLNIK
ncbi:MAG: YceD family protein [Chthoniobacterales bacterium]